MSGIRGGKTEMEIFKADTDIMRSGANRLADAAKELAELSSRMSALSDKVDGKAYQGQLASKVREILAGTVSQAGNMQNLSSSLGTDLSLKAKEIDIANQASSSSMVSLSNTNDTLNDSAIKRLLDKLGVINVKDISRLLMLSGLGGASVPAFLLTLILSNQLKTRTVDSVTKVNNVSGNVQYRTTDRLNFRATHDLSGEKISILAVGSILTLTGSSFLGSNGLKWVEAIDAKGNKGWVAEKYLEEVPSNTPRPEPVPTPKKPDGQQKEGKTSINVGETQSPITSRTQRTLVETSSAGKQCAIYAQQRRPDLGTAGGDGGAANYINNYSSTVFQVTDKDTDLRSVLQKGDAVVWPRNYLGEEGDPGYTYGHVAIIESVDEDKVVVSQANWPGQPTMEIPLSKLQDLYIIP